jgi:hypothetical protein
VQSTINGIGLTANALERAGLDATVVERETGPLGPLMRAAVGDGVAQEDIVVVRGGRSL